MAPATLPKGVVLGPAVDISVIRACVECGATTLDDACCVCGGPTLPPRRGGEVAMTCSTHGRYYAPAGIACAGCGEVGPVEGVSR